MTNLCEESHLLQPFDGSDNRASTSADQVRDPIKARITLMASQIEAVENGTSNLFIGATQSGEADRLEGERDVESL